MKIKGIRIVEPKIVDLSKYFEAKVTVTVRPLPVPARARIQELQTNGMRYATTQRKKSLDIDAIEQAMPAEVTLEIRKIKLAEGVVEYSGIEDDTGARPEWGEEVWSALDEANPNILQKVLDAVTESTYPDDEDGKDPTSPTPSKINHPGFIEGSST